MNFKIPKRNKYKPDHGNKDEEALYGIIEKVKDSMNQVMPIRLSAVVPECRQNKGKYIYYVFIYANGVRDVTNEVNVLVNNHDLGRSKSKKYAGAIMIPSDVYYDDRSTRSDELRKLANVYILQRILKKIRGTRYDGVINDMGINVTDIIDFDKQRSMQEIKEKDKRYE